MPELYMWNSFFEISIGDHTLAGRFDRIDRVGDDDYEIIDYKAAKRVPPQAEVDADLQLGIYALAFKLTTGKLPLVSFYFLPRNVKVTSQRTEGELHLSPSSLSICDECYGLSRCDRIFPVASVVAGDSV